MLKISKIVICKEQNVKENIESSRIFY